MADLKKVQWTIMMDYPLFGHLMHLVEFIEDERVPRGSTDGKRIRYNPTWFATQTNGKGVFFVCHEIGHILGEHMYRLGDRDLAMANEAGDYVINDILSDFGLELIEDCLIDPKYKGLSFERVYSMLEEERKQQKQQEQQQEQQENDENDEAGDDTGSDEQNEQEKGEDEQEQGDDSSDSSDEDGDEQEGEGDGEGEGDSEDEQEGEGSGDSDESSDDGEGSGKGEQGGEGEGEGSGEEFADPNGMGGFHAPTNEKGQPLSSAEVAQEMAEWRQAVAEAVVAQKSMGTLPGSVKRLIEELHCPTMDWKELLRMFAQKAVRKGWSFDRPDRRYIYRDLCLPGRSRKEKVPIIVAVDTSGSIGARELQKFVAGINEMLTCCPDIGEVWVVCCDTRINSVKQFTKDTFPIQIELCGGGGTDFRPPFAWAVEQSAKLGKRFAGLVYLTDMECSSFPEVHPDFPTLWVSTQRVANMWSGYKRPPFGEIAEMVD